MKIIIIIVVLVVIVLGGGGAWFFLIKEDSAPKEDIAALPPNRYSWSWIRLVFMSFGAAGSKIHCPQSHA